MPLDSLQNSSVDDKLIDLQAQPPAGDKNGLCLPPSLVGDQRALVTPSFRFPILMRYVSASNALVLARQTITAGTVGIGQDGAALGWSGNLTDAETNFDKNGIINQQCAWYSDGLTVAVEQALSIGITATIGSTVVKDAGSVTSGDTAVVLPNTATLANFDEFTSQIVQEFFSSTQVSYIAEGETCSYLAGTQLANPSSVGILDGSLPANGNPIKGSYQSYTHAIVQWPTGTNSKSLNLVFNTRRLFAVPFDTTAATNALPTGIGGGGGGLSNGDLVFVVLRVMIPGRYSLKSGRQITSGQSYDPSVQQAIDAALRARGL